MDEEIAAPESSPAKVDDSQKDSVSKVEENANDSVVEQKDKDVNEESEVEHAKLATDSSATDKVDAAVTHEGEEKSVLPNDTSEMKSDEKDTKSDSALMTFEEKKKARAARFNIPVVATATAENAKGKKRSTDGKGNDANDQVKSNKRQRWKSKGKTNVKKDTDDEKTPEVKDSTTPLLLPKDEILKRLKRAEKFNTGDKKVIEELKAMLRLHRFSNK